MRSFILRSSIAACVLFACAACGGSDATDAGTALDAVGADGGETNPALDSGPRDSGRPDSGRSNDAGFTDPATLVMGVEEINGLRTYVHLMGTLTSTLPPVILLHTGPEFSHEYLPGPMRFLLPGRLLLYYDMRATGRSSFGPVGTSTLTAAQHALDVEDVVEWLGTRANATTVDLVGHGYGAGIAALYAAAHPERVGRLVLTAPFPATAIQLANLNAESMSRLTSGERDLVNRLETEPECRGDPSRCTIEIWNIQGPHFLCEQNRARFAELEFLYGAPRAKEFIEFDLREAAYDWSPIFARITAPTTIISGPCDPTPAAAAQTYAASIAGSVHHVFANSGHFPMVEERDAYQTRVLSALRR